MPNWICDKCGRKNKGGTKTCLCKRRIANVTSGKPGTFKDCYNPPKEMCQGLDVCRGKIIKAKYNEFIEVSQEKVVTLGTCFMLPPGFPATLSTLCKKLVTFQIGDFEDVEIRNRKRQVKKREKAREKARQKAAANILLICNE
jgi:hypothetical protein